MCEGKQSEIFQRYAEGSFDPNCCFSLYYGEHMESLDLVSGTGEEARTWITGLKYLMAGISDEDSLAKRQRTRDQYPSVIQQGAPYCDLLPVKNVYCTLIYSFMINNITISFILKHDRLSLPMTSTLFCPEERRFTKSSNNTKE